MVGPPQLAGRQTSTSLGSDGVVSIIGEGVGGGGEAAFFLGFGIRVDGFLRFLSHS